MCLILFSYQLHSEYPLILASNRDEFYDRPTAPAAFWEDEPEILAGRDLKECGTWLGMTESGRIAMLTNYRDPLSIKDDAPSRGELVSNFLLSHEEPTAYVQRVQQRAEEYNGFNLIFGYVSDLYYFSNREGIVQQLVPGLYGLSNHLLDTPWTKVEWGKKRLADLVSENKSFSPGDIFNILADRSRPEDVLLPDTGVGLTWERILAPMFVQSPIYGTRYSTVVLVDRHHNVTFIERVFHSGPDRFNERKFEFTIDQ